jgi:hypothetical protein
VVRVCRAPCTSPQGIPRCPKVPSPATPLAWDRPTTSRLPNLLLVDGHDAVLRGGPPVRSSFCKPESTGVQHIRAQTNTREVRGAPFLPSCGSLTGSAPGCRSASAGGPGAGACCLPGVRFLIRPRPPTTSATDAAARRCWTWPGSPSLAGGSRSASSRPRTGSGSTTTRSSPGGHGVPTSLRR